jgi:hypothetical protein
MEVERSTISIARGAAQELESALPDTGSFASGGPGTRDDPQPIRNSAAAAEA